jgi:hypothetical protein
VEQIQKPARRWIAVLAGLAAGGLLVFVVRFASQSATIGALVSSDIRTVTVKPAGVNALGEPLPEGGLLRIELPPPTPEGANPSETATVAPTPTPAPPPVGTVATNSKAPKVMAVEFVRGPIAASVFIEKGEGFRQWLATPGVQQFLATELGRGLISELARLGRVRAEDLKLEGVKGLFLEPVIGEILAATSALHYDYSYGRQGVMWSVARKEVPILSGLLPVLLRTTAQERFLVPGLPEIYSVQLGHQRLLVAELEGVLYFGIGLRPMMNLLDQAPISAPTPSEAAMSVRLRGEALLNALLPLLVGHDKFEVTIPLALSSGGPSSGGGQRLLPITFGPARVWSTLAGPVDQEILAAIPGDVVLGMAGSFPVPLGLAAEQWQEVAAGRAIEPSLIKAHGVGIVWDLNSTPGEELNQLGIIAKGGDGIDEEVLRSVMREGSGGVASCKAGGILLWASAPKLLTRMREACEGSNRSIKDAVQLASTQLPATSNAQILSSLQLSYGARELLRIGLNGARQEATARLPELSRTSYLAAQEGVGARAEESIGALPSLLYAGSMQGDQLVFSGVVQGVRK